MPYEMGWDYLEQVIQFEILSLSLCHSGSACMVQYAMHAWMVLDTQTAKYIFSVSNI